MKKSAALNNESAADIANGNAGKNISASSLRIEDLSKKIETRLSSVEKNILNKISLTIALKTIQEIFPSLTEEFKRPVDKKRVLVLGNTGAGKSTFIGYLLNYKLDYIDDNGKSVLDYDVKSPDKPTIGHLGSQTKGCKLYTNKESKFEYIDCAGVFDTAGIETELCNAMAISMMTKQSTPDVIIMMISSATVLNNRAMDFIALIDKLRRGLKNPTSQEIWPSIIFVINDKQPMVNNRTRRLMTTTETKNHIINEIGRIIEISRNKCEDLWPSEIKVKFTQAINMIKQQVNNFKQDEQKSDKIATGLEQLEPGLAKEVLSNLRIIEILTLLLNNSQNIIVTDLLSDKTRDEVLTVLGSEERLAIPKDAFTVEQFYQVPSPVLTFQTIISAVASYFTEITSIQKMYQSEMPKLEKLLETNKLTLSDLERKTNAVFLLKHDQIIRQAQEKLESIERELGEKSDNINGFTGKYGELQRLEFAKQVIETEISKLRNSEEPIKLPKISPDRPIEPRGFFQLIDMLASEYLFSYKGDVPIVAVDAVSPTEGGKFIKVKSDYNAGNYSAYYVPAWYGYADDCNATITISIKQKDHPMTAARIRELETKLANLSPGSNLQDKIIQFKSTISELEKKRNELKKKLSIDYQDPSEKNQLAQEYKERAEKIVTENRVLSEKIDQFKKELNVVNLEISAYQDLTALTSFIARNLYADTFFLKSPSISPTASSSALHQWNISTTNSNNKSESSTAPLSGLVYQKISAEGRGLFHAIARCLDKRAEKLREEIAAHMDENYAHFKSFIPGNENEFRKYTNRIRHGVEEDKRDLVEIKAVQRITKRPIVIIRSDVNPTIPDNLTAYSGDPIFIYHNGGNHYDAFTVEPGSSPKVILERIQSSLAKGSSVTYAISKHNNFSNK